MPATKPAFVKPFELKWRQDPQGPEYFSSVKGTAIAHKDTAYFSHYSVIYAFTPPHWKYILSRNEFFSMAVVDDRVATVGGQQCGGGPVTNSLRTLLPDSTWKALFPPMPTKRIRPATVATKFHLVAAGGRKSNTEESISIIEVLDIVTLQWSTATYSLPKSSTYIPRMILCSGQIYLRQGRIVQSCSVDDLLKGATSTSSGCLWTELPNVPIHSSLVSLKDQVLVIGGKLAEPTPLISCFDASTNSWKAIGELPIPRFCALAVTLSDSKMILVGGYSGRYITNEVFISDNV